MLGTALNSSLTNKAKGHSEIVKKEAKHRLKEHEANKKNLVYQSALTGLQNHHAMKHHLPYTVTVPGKADIDFSMKGITGI